jgi:hypothetical protein
MSVKVGIGVGIVILFAIVVGAVIAHNGKDPGAAAVQSYIDNNGNTGNSGVNLTASCSFTGQYNQGNKVYSCTYSGGDQSAQVANGTGVGAWGSCFDVGPAGASPDPQANC